MLTMRKGTDFCQVHGGLISYKTGSHNILSDFVYTVDYAITTQVCLLLDVGIWCIYTFSHSSIPETTVSSVLTWNCFIFNLIHMYIYTK